MMVGKGAELESVVAVVELLLGAWVELMATLDVSIEVVCCWLACAVSVDDGAEVVTVGGGPSRRFTRPAAASWRQSSTHSSGHVREARDDLMLLRGLACAGEGKRCGRSQARSSLERSRRREEKQRAPHGCTGSLTDHIKVEGQILEKVPEERRGGGPAAPSPGIWERARKTEQKETGLNAPPPPGESCEPLGRDFPMRGEDPRQGLLELEKETA